VELTAVELMMEMTPVEWMTPVELTAAPTPAQ
jgi:hypothetical protein